jgi:hypothetical protein
MSKSFAADGAAASTEALEEVCPDAKAAGAKPRAARNLRLLFMSQEWGRQGHDRKAPRCNFFAGP